MRIKLTYNFLISWYILYHKCRWLIDLYKFFTHKLYAKYMGNLLYPSTFQVHVVHVFQRHPSMCQYMYVYKFCMYIYMYMHTDMVNICMSINIHTYCAGTTLQVYYVMMQQENVHDYFTSFFIQKIKLFLDFSNFTSRSLILVLIGCFCVNFMVASSFSVICTRRSIFLCCCDVCRKTQFQLFFLVLFNYRILSTIQLVIVIIIRQKSRSRTYYCLWKVEFEAEGWRLTAVVLKQIIKTQHPQSLVQKYWPRTNTLRQRIDGYSCRVKHVRWTTECITLVVNCESYDGSIFQPNQYNPVFKLVWHKSGNYISL